MTAPTAPPSPQRLAAVRRVSLAAAVPGGIAVALMLVWAVHNGGYDADTWYWGALVLLSALAGAIVVLGPERLRLSRRGTIALAAFAGYVAWSYLSILWAQSPGDALEGSNRALLYLLLFSLLLLLPWNAETALLALLSFVIGVGVIAIVLLFRLGAGDRVGELVIQGRLAAPTGYFNATAALFTILAFTATALGARRELPGLLRGLLLAMACAGFQLGVIVQSRGWLFTLPIIAVLAVIIARERVRFLLFALIPVIGALVPLHRLLHVFQATSGPALTHAAKSAGEPALIICFAVLVIGTLAAWADSLIRVKPPTPVRRRILGVAAVLLTVLACAAGAAVATHGHPFSFVRRQWNGFSHVQTNFSKGTHFGDVGSGRYDFWRVSLDAFLAHPVGGLGQDNFDNYYIRRGRSGEEPKWTHSLEMRLLAHTGIVGTALFAVFLLALLAGAIRALRSREALVGGVCAAALMPLTVWFVHGSVDWFWEIPALTGPALGFAAIAASLGAATPGRGRAAGPARRPRRPARTGRQTARAGRPRAPGRSPWPWRVARCSWPSPSCSRSPTSPCVRPRAAPISPPPTRPRPSPRSTPPPSSIRSLRPRTAWPARSPCSPACRTPPSSGSVRPPTGIPAAGSLGTGPASPPPPSAIRRPPPPTSASPTRSIVDSRRSLSP